MIGRGSALPDGYRAHDLGRLRLVALDSLADAVLEAVQDGSLYDYASRHPQARTFLGRGVAYAVPLPGDVARVVVRHARHGGLLAPLTGDRFLSPTRAPRELQAAVRLARDGVPTPEIIAYATYPAGALLSRSDIATREVLGSRDLGMLLLSPPSAAARTGALEAVGRLLGQLTRVGARHPDLNLKNVLIAPHAAGAEAWLLDVDTVRFGTPGDRRIADGNAIRLTRSLAKWRRLYGLEVSDGELQALQAAALDSAASGRS